MISCIVVIVFLIILNLILHYQIREFLIKKGIESGSWWGIVQEFVNLPRYYEFCKTNNLSLVRFYLSIVVKILLLIVIIVCFIIF